MEAEQQIGKGVAQGEPLLIMLATTTQLPIISSTLDFLDEEELVTIAQVALHSKLTTQFFMVAVAKAFLKKYLNRVDRSVFFVFYEDLDFRHIEQNTINILASQHSHLLRPAYLAYRDILQAISTNHQYLSAQLEFQALLQQLFLEPDLPMPKLKRESIGMFCETGFQEYLSLIKFPSDQLQQWIEEPLEQLREQLAEELAELAQKMIYSDYGKQDLNRKIRVVRFCGYKVNGQNWRDYLIEGFKSHNLLVLMLALCSQMVITFKQLIAQIADPFMKFTEFGLRSNIYRNIVLSIEQKFSFVFSNYSEFYSTCFTTNVLFPPMNFWRPALSIWAQHMKAFHSSNHIAYNYITAKLREANLKQLLAIKTQKLPSFFSELKREIDLQSFSQTRKNAFYEQNGHHLQMEAYFQDNQEMYETLAKDYIEYMVDISMNEFNVHWCGHSNHVIKEYSAFAPFMRNIVGETQELYSFIKQVLNHSVPKQIRLNIFKEVIKQDLIFSEQRLFKPVIIREITSMVNSWIKDDVESLSQFMVFSEEGYIKHRISMDFQEKDGLLSYFSSKYSIPEDCPQEFRLLYNIQFEDTQPAFFKEKEEQMEDIEAMEKYMSEEEDQMAEEGQNNKQ